MKVVIASLFILVMMFSFVVAESSSSIGVDFYIQTEGMTGGYEEDVVNTDSQQSEWLGKVISWAVIIIILGILIKVLRKVAEKVSKSKISRKKVRKKSRRKK